MRDIVNYPAYYFDENTENVYMRKNNKQIKTHKTSKGLVRFKLKDKDNCWKSIAVTGIKALAGIKLTLPSGTKNIFNSTEDYFIDTVGNIYSFSTIKTGRIIKHFMGTTGYICVSIPYKGKQRTVEVHKLMLETFIMPNYVEHGYVGMHKDNNKINPELSNLKLGSYSENNKDAYTDGLNPGNGLKKKV